MAEEAETSEYFSILVQNSPIADSLKPFRYSYLFLGPLGTSEEKDVTHNPETGAKYYKMDEIAKHDVVGSLWLVIDNGVFDITAFTLEHPGGEEILFEQGGKDASTPFEDVGHSSDAKELMQKYLIGELHPNDRKEKETKKRSQRSDGQNNADDTQRGWFSQLLFGVGLALVGLAAYKFIG